MEDVVLHYRPGSDARINSLLETTEKLLKPFPCRTPPLFTPWFSASRLPIRPAKSAPVITSFDNRPGLESIVQRVGDHLSADRLIQDPTDFVCGTKENLPPSDLKNSSSSPPDHKHYYPVKSSPSRRSWSVFTQRRSAAELSATVQTLLSRGLCAQAAPPPEGQMGDQ